ncbi:hypothetical protein V2G26_008286 [Clonostachys chloroleuca]
MDARALQPFRPRGTENAIHQRHNSTGNIANSHASTAGFRGQAKRAAFGDVTNLAKAVGAKREDAKVVKVKSVGQFNHATRPVNKENVLVSKDGLARPAQRTVAVANKAKRGLENRANEPNKKLEQAAPRENAVATYAETREALKMQNTNRASHERRGSQKSSLETRPQPRHHKSQPQLKQRQPTLRRTQSRQLERTETILESTSQSVATESQVTSSPETQTDSDGSAPVSVEAASQSVQVENHLEMPSRLPEISEESGVVPANYADGTAPGLSEPEEYWDEDDEDYDDQDQAYTTAHSFRSRDMTTGGPTTLLQPKVSLRIQRELEEARIEVEQTRQPEDIEEEAWDVSMVAEYGEEIFEYMRELEVKMLPNPHYMDIQTEIQWSMRSVLMDWLVQVHSRFSLLPETLFLTVNYIDRFLSQKIVSIGKLQLVGATAILVASKYEEINCPSLQEIVYMVDNGYTAEEILKAERFMLSMLQFELGWPGPMSFLRRVSKADDYDLETRTLAKYFLELTIMDERFVASPPSYLAAGAHCLSRLILQKGEWTKHHVHYSGYTWSQLRPLVSMMIGCCEQPRLHHGAVYEKYCDKRFKEASLIVQDALEQGFALSQYTSSLRMLPSQPPCLDDASDQLYHQGHLVPIET